MSAKPFFILALGIACTVAAIAAPEAKPLKYRQRFVKGKPVQGPVVPGPKPTPKPSYPVWGSLEEIAKLADEIRIKKGILNVSPYALATPLPTHTATPEGTPPPTEAPPTPSPTPVSLFAEGTPVPEVIVDNGPLTDITLLRVAPDRNTEPQHDISIGNEVAERLRQDAVDTDQILGPEAANRFERGAKALSEGRFEEGLEIVHAIRMDRPRYLAAWVLEIGTLVRLGRNSEVEQLVTMFDALFPEVRGTSFVERLHRPGIVAPPETKVESTAPTSAPTALPTPSPLVSPTPEPTTTPTSTAKSAPPLLQGPARVE